MTRTHLTYHETATLRGVVYADLGTGAAVQPFKYGDKELDLTNGIARYDYTISQTFYLTETVDL